ncbi:MAG: LysR family transcriptional regulator [Spirochaetaceae bacterium]|nr:LysR family transcriptional regulator [Spirochaetaceae bacterium]
MSTLLAFEATARLGSMTLAAEERATSHSAISRNIRVLEKTLGVALFERRGRGVALTKSGETYFGAVQSGLGALHDASQGMRNRQPRLNIGCTLEMSLVVLNRVLLALKRSLGDSIAVRIVVYDYDLLPLLLPSGVDIVFEGVAGPHPNRQAVALLREEIVPVASPAFMERFGSVLGEHPSTWRDVPRLDVPRTSSGWATWDTWFRAHGCAAPPASVETFENQVNLLPAVANGEGLGIGWNGFVSDYFESGRLVAARDAWLATGITMYGVPTPNGSRKDASRACLNELPRIFRGLCTHLG